MKKHLQMAICWLITTAAVVGLGIPASTWAAPTCRVEIQDPGPPKVISLIFQESQVGLKEVRVREYQNARVTIPPVRPPDKEPVVVTVRPVNPGLEFSAMVMAIDMNNQTATCSWPGAEPPQCSVIDEDPGPPFTVSISFQDDTEGLGSITLDSAENAEVSIPAFTPGTTDAVIVTAEKKDEFENLEVTLTATDTNQNQNDCSYNQQAQNDPVDPMVMLTLLDSGPPSRLEITARDQESGLAAINILEADNMDVQIPEFAIGTTDPVVITADQKNESLRYLVEVEVVDRAGNKTTYQWGITQQGLRSEIDLVGDDSEYFFRDDWIDQILINGRDALGKRINDFSAFQSESFYTQAGQPSNDTCYSLPSRTYESVFTPTWSEADYEWEIVLQMKPSTDLVLKLRGCVLKTDEKDAWTAAYQTGFHRVPWAPDQPEFISIVNPSLSAQALPGPMAHEDFPTEGFILDTRRQTGLQVAPLDDSLVTIQAIAGESIVIALPAEGGFNASGQTTYALSPGDRIKVRIHIPNNTPSDVRFGADGVMVQYIGLTGTEYLAGP